MKEGHDIIRFFSPLLSDSLKKGKIAQNNDVSEIRLSAGAPVSVRGTRPGNRFLGYDGNLTDDILEAVICRREDIEYSFREICDSSVYSYENEIREGFVTLPGGHRVGIAGKAVAENGTVKTVNEISSMNFRIARQVSGCADEVYRTIKDFCPCSVLVYGAPSSGKTTLLRDLCRILSHHYRVSLIDERQEIAASYKGVPQNDVGPCCDVFSSYPKDKAVETAVRVMSPDIIVCDEIGNDNDLRVIKKAANTGVSIIASVHSGSQEELIRKSGITELIKSGIFRFVVFMDAAAKSADVKEAEEISFILNCS